MRWQTVKFSQKRLCWGRQMGAEYSSARVSVRDFLKESKPFGIVFIVKGQADANDFSGDF